MSRRLSERQAQALLGARLSPAEVKAAKARDGRRDWKWYGVMTTRRGPARQCRCGRWFIAATSYTVKAHTDRIAGHVEAFTRRLRCQTCRDCRARTLAKRRERDYATKRAKRLEARTGLVCLVCRRPLTAERRSRRFCGATCRQRHARQRRAPGCETSGSVTPEPMSGRRRPHVA